MDIPDISDIDPAVAEAVLARADEFLALQEEVDRIIAEGDGELQKEEERLTAAGGTEEDYRAAAARIEKEVGTKLASVEDRLRKRYE